MTDRESSIRAKLFRTFGGPSYYTEHGNDAFSQLLEDAKYLCNLLYLERKSWDEPKPKRKRATKEEMQARKAHKLKRRIQNEK